MPTITTSEYVVFCGFNAKSFVSSCRTSWTIEDAKKDPKCNNKDVKQEEADFTNCVDGTVTTNYGTPYDWDSIMHYRRNRYREQEMQFHFTT